LGHTLAVVVDATPDSSAAFARQVQAEDWANDIETAMAAEVDCVHICTPPALHYPLLRTALLAGKHVVSEKPLTLLPEQAAELLRLAEGRVHAVGFNLRFYAAIQAAAQAVQAADFGAVYMIHGAYLQSFHALPAPFTWRYQAALAGPMRAVTEIGSHWIDLARFLTGLEVLEVSARFSTLHPRRYLKDGQMFATPSRGAAPLHVDNEDAAVIALRFSNGALGSLSLSEAAHGRQNALGVAIEGAQRSLWWQAEDPHHLHIGQGGQSLTHTFPFSGGYPESLLAMLEAVYADIAAGGPSPHPLYATFADGWANAAVCQAIYASAQAQGAWQNVPDQPPSAR
jgi:predicted dehydrogenase